MDVRSNRWEGALTDPEPEEALVRAVLAGDAAAARAALAAGAPADLRTDQAPPGVDTWDRCASAPVLAVAAAMGAVGVVEALLEAGATVDAPRSKLLCSPISDHEWMEDDGTALSVASRAGHEVVVGALLAAGASPDVRDRIQRTPLCLAATAGDEAVLYRLLAAGADLGYARRWAEPMPQVHALLARLQWAADD